MDEAGEPARFSHILTSAKGNASPEPLEEWKPGRGEAEVVLLHVVPEGEEETYVTLPQRSVATEVCPAHLALMDEIQEGEA